MTRRPYAASCRAAALLLSLSLAACGAESDVVGDTTAAEEQSAPAAQAVGNSPYDAPGPYEVVQVDNVGRGFGTGAGDDSAICRLVVPLLDNGTATKEELDTFSKWPDGMDRTLYTMFRPKTLEDGKKYPVIVWGNGTCATPVGYRRLLTQLASHGFIVIGPNSRQVGNGQVILKALDFLASENAKASSELYGKVDLTRVGASGHSQGSAAALQITSDRRIATTVAIQGAGGSPSHGKPMFYIAGDKDTVVSPTSVRNGYNGVRGPVVYGLAKGVDHITPIRNPQYIWGPIVAWFKGQLEDDAAAKSWFYGTCSFCSNPNWTVQRKSIN